MIIFFFAVVIQTVITDTATWLASVRKITIILAQAKLKIKDTIDKKYTNIFNLYSKIEKDIVMSC